MKQSSIYGFLVICFMYSYTIPEVGVALEKHVQLKILNLALIPRVGDCRMTLPSLAESTVFTKCQNLCQAYFVKHLVKVEHSA